MMIPICNCSEISFRLDSIGKMNHLHFYSCKTYFSYTGRTVWENGWMKISQINGSAEEAWRCQYSKPLMLPNLNPCNYFLWGHIKNKVYDRNDENINNPKTGFSTAFKAVSSEMVVTKVILRNDRTWCL